MTDSIAVQRSLENLEKQRFGAIQTGTVEQRVSALEEASLTSTVSVSADEDYRLMIARANSHYSQLCKQISESTAALEQTFLSQLNSLTASHVQSIEASLKKLVADVGQSAVDSLQKIADEAQKKIQNRILITRPAQRGETADVVTRQATIQEVRDASKQ